MFIRACRQFDGAQFINSYSCYSTTFSFPLSLSHSHDILKVAIFHFANCNQPRNYSSSDSLRYETDENIFIASTFGNKTSTNGNFIKFMKQSAFFSVLLNQQESARNFCSLSLCFFFLKNSLKIMDEFNEKKN